jgi:hypothetical protein
MSDRENPTTAADQVAEALEALVRRAWHRCLFPAEVKAAFAALDAYGWPSLKDGGQDGG